MTAAFAGFERLQRYLDTYMVNRMRLERNPAYVTTQIFKTAVIGLAIALPVHAGLAGQRVLHEGESLGSAMAYQFRSLEGWWATLTHPWFLGLFSVALVLFLRRVLLRLEMRY